MLISCPKNNLMLTEDLVNNLIRTDSLEIIYPVQGRGTKTIPYTVACPPMGDIGKYPLPLGNEPKQSPPRLKLDPKIFYALECNPSLYKALKKDSVKISPPPLKKKVCQAAPGFCTSPSSIYSPPPHWGRASCGKFDRMKHA